MLTLRTVVSAMVFSTVFGVWGCGAPNGAPTLAATDRVTSALWGEPGDQAGDQAAGQDQQQGQQEQGQQEQGQQEQAEQPDQQGQAGATNPNAATCDAIHEKLVARRADLQATPEWQALAQTPEYAAVDATSQELQTACAGHDATHAPSAQCVAVYTQFKADLAAMKATPQWAAVETTPAYTILKNTYDAYHAAGCGHVPSSGDANGVI